MEAPAPRKYHFAPYRRQRAAVERLLRTGRFRNATEFMRNAIDHYLDSLGLPPLSEQARQMAEEWSGTQTSDPGALQTSSMESDETW